jgi:hypothetical protein
MIRKWFEIQWWLYLFEKPVNIRKFLCRASGHKHGVIWFTLNALEPDMHCIDCGDDLG